MMRRLHRWLGLLTGVFLAVVAVTGIGMQVISLVSPEQHGPPGLAAGGPAQGLPGRPQPGPAPGPPEPHDLDFRGWLDHIHDGEVAGNAGRVVSLAFGVALLFFSISGIWMYARMFSARRRNGAGDLFW